MYSKDKITVFLSHSHKDIDKVRKIRDVLETLNCEPLTFFLKCLDDDNEELEEFIKKEIEARNIFVYCKSINSEQSDWVQKELQHIKSFDEKRLYTIDLDKAFEYSLVVLLKDIINIIHRNTIIIWRGKASAEISLSIGNFLQERGFLVHYFEPNIQCERDWNKMQVWEWTSVHDRYSSYIEEQVLDLADKGVFLPIISNELSDGGWNSFMSSKIIHTINKKQGIYSLPLFLDIEVSEGSNGLTIHSKDITSDLLALIDKLNIIISN